MEIIGSGCGKRRRSMVSSFPNGESPVWMTASRMSQVRSATARRLMKFLRVLWASPYTLIGLLLGLATVLAGGQVRWTRQAVEFSGGILPRLFRCLPRGRFIRAMTLGHTILGVDQATLELVRRHEWAHVEQFERWGILMGPAYLAMSLVVWLKGCDPYWDNPFECQARLREGFDGQEPVRENS